MIVTNYKYNEQQRQVLILSSALNKERALRQDIEASGCNIVGAVWFGMLVKIEEHEGANGFRIKPGHAVTTYLQLRS